MQGKKIIILLVLLMVLMPCIPTLNVHAEGDTVDIMIKIEYTVGTDVRNGSQVDNKYDVRFSCGSSCPKTIYELNSAYVIYKVTVPKTVSSDNPLKIVMTDNAPGENDKFGLTERVTASKISGFNFYEASRKCIYQSDDGSDNRYRTQSINFYGNFTEDSSIIFRIETGSIYQTGKPGWNYGSGLSQSQAPAVGGVSLNGYDVSVAPTTTDHEPTSLWERLAVSLADLHDVISIITNFVLAVGILTGILTIIIQAIKISTMASHPIQRRTAMINLGASVISIMMIGSIWLIMNLIYHTIL